MRGIRLDSRQDVACSWCEKGSAGSRSMTPSRRSRCTARAVRGVSSRAGSSTGAARRASPQGALRLGGRGCVATGVMFWRSFCTAASARSMIRPTPTPFRYHAWGGYSPTEGATLAGGIAAQVVGIFAIGAWSAIVLTMVPARNLNEPWHTRFGMTSKISRNRLCCRPRAVFLRGATRHAKVWVSYGSDCCHLLSAYVASFCAVLLRYEEDGLPARVGGNRGPGP